MSLSFFMFQLKKVGKQKTFQGKSLNKQALNDEGGKANFQSKERQTLNTRASSNKLPKPRFKKKALNDNGYFKR